jgi:predicted HD phosphohydrolase
MTPATLAAIADLYAARGGERYGEDVTQVEHAVQSALVAMAFDAAPVLIAATLLHDVGHLLAAGSLGDDDHAGIGATALAAVFGPAVGTPVALHVAAKRYLCATEPGYRATLSRASQHSLARQGGPFDAAAAARFITLPYAAAAVLLRRCDDSGKRNAASGCAFADFMPLLARLSQRRGTA